MSDDVDMLGKVEGAQIMEERPVSGDVLYRTPKGKGSKDKSIPYSDRQSPWMDEVDRLK